MIDNVKINFQKQQKTVTEKMDDLKMIQWNKEKEKALKVFESMQNRKENLSGNARRISKDAPFISIIISKYFLFESYSWYSHIKNRIFNSIMSCDLAAVGRGLHFHGDSFMP